MALRRLPLRRPRFAPLLGAAASCLLGLGLLPVVPAAAGDIEVPPAPADVRFIQANIYSGLSVAKFQADVDTVLRRGPDFVSYNEVPRRKDAVLAPAPYQVQRSMRNRYTAATAIAWRSDRWTKVDSGTFRISNWRGVPPGKKVELGRRFANWVTVTSADGRVVSAIAVHFAPPARGMPDLRPRSARRLGALVDRLATKGQVLVGGDLNMHYRAPAYTGATFAEHSLVPIWDTLGYTFRTHGRYTIDYVMSRSEGELVAEDAARIALNSDHAGVQSDLAWTVDAPTQTTEVRNDPDGSAEDKARVVRTVGQAVKATPAGGSVDLVTGSLDTRRTFRALKRAVGRGVAVRLTTRSAELSPRERRLRRLLDSSPTGSFTQCVDACAAAWREASGPRTLLVSAGADSVATDRVDLRRNLTRAAIDRRSIAWSRTGHYSLTEGRDLLGTLP